MEILRRSPSRLQNAVTIAMVIVTGFQTAMNIWTMGIMVRWWLFTTHKLLLGLLVLVELGAVWGCLAGFNRTSQRRTALLFAFGWVVLTVLATFSPFIGSKWLHFISSK